MPRISSRSPSAGPMLAKREPFTTHGALSALDYPPTCTGRLPADWAHRYHADTPKITYVALSYATPIGWVLPDEVVIPDVAYSVTTARHQTLCRAWL